MHIVDFKGTKIEIVMDAGAELAMQRLLQAVREEGGVGLVLPDGESFKLEKHDRDGKEASKMQKNIKAEQPAKHDLPWSANDYANLSERFRSDDSTTINSLAAEFERTPIGIQNQLQKMWLLDRFGDEFIYNKKMPEPRKKYLYGDQIPAGAEDGEAPIL